VHFHCDNNDAVVNIAAVTMTTTKSLVAMALSAAQNNNQQIKGANKRGDSIVNGDGNGNGKGDNDG
jgi:hypothetical protein